MDLPHDEPPAEAASLWTRQRRYFEVRGPDAWRQGDVPHYVTSNPAMAEAYAALVRGFLADRRALGAAPNGEEPLHIIELGAGSGRFAYHFLRAIERRRHLLGEAWPPLRYVLTDVSAPILEGWAAHPWLRPFIEAGQLDIAAFDVEHDRSLALRAGGRTIGPGDLAHPPVVVANYLFDTIPQDVFRLRDGAVWRALPEIAAAADEADPSLDAAEVSWRYEPLAGAPYDEAPLQQLFETYRRSLSDTHLVFPAAGLRAIARLCALSPGGCLVLAADKGPLALEALEGQAPPFIARHGSVSLPVNFHALAAACETAGGLALTSSRTERGLKIVALLQTAGAASHANTRAAYLDVIETFGPDDAYELFRMFRARLDTLAFDEIAAALRFSHDDAHQFAWCLPRLNTLAAGLDTSQRGELVALCERVWAGYLPLGEELDLAAAIGALLYAIEAYGPALAFHERSQAIYGPDSGGLFNTAACHWMLGDADAAAGLLRRVLAADPANTEAEALLAECG